MTAVIEVEAHDRVARLQERRINRAVGRRAAEGLHVDIEIIGRETIGGKQFGSSPARQSFEHIRIFDALVVARIAVATIGASSISKSRISDCVCWRLSSRG